jgi:hypothetical protein
MLGNGCLPNAFPTDQFLLDLDVCAAREIAELRHLGQKTDTTVFIILVGDDPIANRGFIQTIAHAKLLLAFLLQASLLSCAHKSQQGTFVVAIDTPQRTIGHRTFTGHVNLIVASTCLWDSLPRKFMRQEMEASYQSQIARFQIQDLPGTVYKLAFMAATSVDMALINSLEQLT